VYYFSRKLHKHSTSEGGYHFDEKVDYFTTLTFTEVQNYVIMIPSYLETAIALSMNVYNRRQEYIVVGWAGIELIKLK